MTQLHLVCGIPVSAISYIFFVYITISFYFTIILDMDTGLQACTCYLSDIFLSFSVVLYGFSSVWGATGGVPLPLCQLARLWGPQMCYSHVGLP